MVASARTAESGTQTAAPSRNRSNTISTPMALFMVMVAVSFDLIQFIATFFHVLNVFDVVPVLGWAIGFFGSALAFIIPWFIGIFSQMIFYMWFLLLGANTDRNFATRFFIYAGTIVVELVPIIDMLPAITFGVVALILLSRAEDLFEKEQGLPLGKLTTLIRGHVPLAQRGVDQYQQGRAEIEKKAPAKAVAFGQKYVSEYKQKQMAEALRKPILTHAEIEAAMRRRGKNNETP